MTSFVGRSWRRSLITDVRGALMALVLAGVQLGWQSSAHAVDSTVRLVMFEAPNCPFCRRWHAEIGAIYPKSPEGQFAPLERRAIAEARALALADVRYSPTFVVMKDGLEIGRVVGYSGPDFFWPQLEEVLIRAGYRRP